MATTNTLTHKRIDVNKSVIYLNGEQVDIVYGPEANVRPVLTEWREALKTDSRIERYANTPLADIPDNYWKNGHIAPMGVA